GRTFPFTLLPALTEALLVQNLVHKVLAKEGVICRWVFNRDGKPLFDAAGRVKTTVRDAWEKACTEAGCPGRIFHDFRRTAVRNPMRAGVSERMAMQLTGHKTRSVFDRYDICSEKDLREAVQKLAVFTGVSAADQADWQERLEHRFDRAPIEGLVQTGVKTL